MQPRTFVVLATLFLFQAFVSQGQGVDIVDTAIANADFATLVRALQAADLVAALKGPGPFTVFAPTDAAFNKLPAGTVDDLLQPENKAKLARILKYHVLANQNLTAAAIVALNPPVNLETLSGNPVTVTIDGSNVKVNDATVVLADVFATNGIIHAIDTVLMPPAEVADIVDTAIANGAFKTLVTALIAADLATALKGPGPFTVFAPTDDAFNKLPAGTVEDLLKPENKDKLARILKYHVIANQNLTAAAINAMTLPAKVETLSGDAVTVSKDGSNLKVNDATVIIADVFATNGIIHAIDTVLMPPADLADIVDTAVANGAFKTLVAALTAADLVSALKGPGPFTVFAPTDDAFNKLPAGTVEDLLKPENKDKLARILKYHVIANQNLTAAAINAMTLPAKVETLSGDAVTVSKDGSNLKVNDATVIIADVFATNGIIHAIDTVLMPPAELADIVDTAVANGAFKTLVTALTAADLVTALKGTGPFTVFAPTDAAFDKLPAGTVADLLKPENKDKLARILKYHVLANQNLTAAAINAMTLPAKVETLSGYPVTVSKDGNSIKVNDATVTTADVFATNGIIHAIDTVLMPPAELADIVDTAVANGAFKTLVAALTAADLVTALKSPGPFTVFAPTDAAFDKLPAGTVADLLKPENKDKLARILKYHVLANQNLTAAAINAMTLPAKVETLSGYPVTVSKDGNSIKVNDATVTTADVFATNGIIHAIDTVLMPPAELADIVDTAVANGAFKTLVSALTAAELVAALKGTGPFTVFAPTDDAFNKLPAETLADLLKPENKVKLTGILKYHVLANQNLTAAAISAMTLPAKVETLSGNSVVVSKDGNSLKVNNATVIVADVFATNGIIHAIDEVLMPPPSPPNLAACLHLSSGLITVVVMSMLLSYHCFF